MDPTLLLCLDKSLKLNKKDIHIIEHIMIFNLQINIISLFHVLIGRKVVQIQSLASDLLVQGLNLISNGLKVTTPSTFQNQHHTK